MSILIDGTNGITFPNSTTQASAGQVLQVVQTYLPSSFSTSSSSWTDWTGMTATITPKFSTSKILVTLTSGCSNNTLDTFQFVKLVRNSTDIALGNAAGSATRCWIDASQQSAGAVNVWQKGLAGTFLDSPATTSATTYKLQVIVTRAGTAYFGQTAETSDANRSATSSSLTLMEIAA
jgi:hypothetical protein